MPYYNKIKNVKITPKQQDNIDLLINIRSNYSQDSCFYFLDLLDGETDTCLEQFVQINYRCMQKNIGKPVYYNIRDKNDLFEKLELIRRNSLLNNAKPIIHIEAHGDINLGIRINNSKEMVPFNELLSKFREINFAYHNNLLLILPICYGLYIALHDKDNIFCAPFYALIAPKGIIQEKKVRNLYYFYDEIFKEFDLEKAYQVIKQDYDLISSEKLFLESFLKYYIFNKKSKNKSKRINCLLTSLCLRGYPKGNINILRDYLKNAINDTKSAFLYLKSKYLMTYHNNQSERFDYSYEDFKYLCVESC